MGQSKACILVLLLFIQLNSQTFNIRERSVPIINPKTIPLRVVTLKTIDACVYRGEANLNIQDGDQAHLEY